MTPPTFLVPCPRIVTVSFDKQCTSLFVNSPATAGGALEVNGPIVFPPMSCDIIHPILYVRDTRDTYGGVTKGGDQFC